MLLIHFAKISPMLHKILEAVLNQFRNWIPAGSEHVGSRQRNITWPFRQGRGEDGFSRKVQAQRPSCAHFLSCEVRAEGLWKEPYRLAAHQPPPGKDVLSEAWYRDQSPVERDPIIPQSGNAMGRFLRVAGLTILLLLVFDLVLRATLPETELLEEKDSGALHYLAKIRQLEQGPTPDVLVLGSSRVRRAIIPDVMEAELSQVLKVPTKVFNLGLNNAKIAEYHALISSHLPDPPPRFVILGFSGTEVVNEHSFNVASSAAWKLGDCIDYLKRTPFKHFQLKHVENYLLLELSRAWYMFDRREELGNSLAWKIENNLGLVPEINRKRREKLLQNIQVILSSNDGYWEMVDTTEVGILANRLERNPDAVRIPPRELILPPEIVYGGRFSMLRETVLRLRDHGCKVALVETPPSPWLQNQNPVMHGSGLPPSRRYPSGVPGFRTRMKELSEELGITFITFNAKNCGLTNSFYLDINHMTHDGATKFSQMMVKRLWRAGFFEVQSK